MESVSRDLYRRGANQRFNDIAPILRFCMDVANSISDDFIFEDTLMPIGWIAIAEKDGVLPPSNSNIDKDTLLKRIRQ